MDVERSDDGQHFSVLASLLPRAGEAGVVDYSYTDASPLPQGFYRLHLKEWTGNALYSPIVALRRSAVKTLSVYPNIATTSIEVDGISGAGNLEVLSADGQRLLTKPLNGDAHCALDVAGLSTGMYLLRVAAGGNLQTIRFFKQ